MTQTSPIGRRAAGTKREIAILATEAALDKPKRLPANVLLSCFRSRAYLAMRHCSSLRLAACSLA